MPPDLYKFEREFAQSLGRPAAGPMAVYRNTVLHGAVEALRANFPVVEQILGDEMFEGVAVEFAGECPPNRPILALYGARFAQWLERQPWTEDLPYLSDVARVERLRVECIMAADAEPLAAGPNTRRDNLGGLALCLHPAARFTWLSTPAMSIWLAHQRPLALAFEPEWKAEGALFARPSPFIVHAPRIGRAAHRILSGIRIGETVGASIAAAARLYPHQDCYALFASFVELGLFIAPASERISS